MDRDTIYSLLTLLAFLFFILRSSGGSKKSETQIPRPPAPPAKTHREQSDWAKLEDWHREPELMDFFEEKKKPLHPPAMAIVREDKTLPPSPKNSRASRIRKLAKNGKDSIILGEIFYPLGFRDKF